MIKQNLMSRRITTKRKVPAWYQAMPIALLRLLKLRILNYLRSGILGATLSGTETGVTRVSFGLKK
jgi:hypothetical protein